ncbi:hypothetical protein AX018_102817, partial [Paracidovorax anthurii]
MHSEVAMNAKVGNLSSPLLPGLLLPKDSGQITIPVPKRPDSQKNLSGPEGLQTRDNSSRDVGANRPPRGGLPKANELQNNRLFQAQQRKNNPEAAAAEHKPGPAAHERKSFTPSSSLKNNPLFLAQQKKNNAEAAAAENKPGPVAHERKSFTPSDSLQSNPLFLKQQTQNNPEAAPTAVPEKKAEVQTEPTA